MKKATIGDIINHLRKFPQNTPVMISSDPEGNCYSPLDLDLSFAGLVQAKPDLSDVCFDSEDPKGVTAFVIYPAN